MYRSSSGLAAIWFVSGAVIAPGASAEDTKPTPLPEVVVDAPQQRPDARSKPIRGVDRGGRSRRSPIQNPAPVASAAPVNASPAAAAPVASSSEKNVGGDDVNARPFSRPAEALEVVPGLIVTQHSGDGKANQYFLRSFKLDHGTDLAITVDGMPVNMRTHAHGQGYADLNFLIPELIGSVNIRRDRISPTRATSPRWDRSTSVCSTASRRRWHRSPPEASAIGEFSASRPISSARARS